MSFLRSTKTLLHPKKALKDLMANVGAKIHQFMMACNFGKIFKIDRTSNPHLCGEPTPRVSVSSPSESDHADHTPAAIHSPKSVPPVFCPLPIQYSTDSSGADDTKDEEQEEEEKESHVLDYIVTFPDSDSDSGADELSKVPDGCLCPDQEYTVTFPDSTDSESESDAEEEQVFVHKDHCLNSDDGDDQFHFATPHQEEDMYAHQHCGFQCHHHDYHGDRHHHDEGYGYQYYGWTGFYYVRQPPF
nr:uncharacterized protein LOC113743248 [Coffea arabica]